MKALRGECPSSNLPSYSSAVKLVRGEPGGLSGVILSTAGRAALIGSGLYVLGGQRENLLKLSLAGAVGIEVFVLAWAAFAEK